MRHVHLIRLTCLLAIDKSTITFAEYIAVMEKATLHEDPTVALKDAFSIFDRCLDLRGWLVSHPTCSVTALE